tara:strand:+ start:437 stop:622 length:186 start_codon:yes stop_codon:yes gene_type:complete
MYFQKRSTIAYGATVQRCFVKKTSHLIDNAKLATVQALFYPGKNNNTYLAFILRKPSPDVH